MILLAIICSVLYFLDLISRSWSAFVECDQPIRITGSYLSRSRADHYWNRAQDINSRGIAIVLTEYSGLSSRVGYWTVQWYRIIMKTLMISGMKIDKRPQVFKMTNILSRKVPDSNFHGVHMGPIGPIWDPCWPHEPCYQGSWLIWAASISSSNRGSFRSPVYHIIMWTQVPDLEAITASLTGLWQKNDWKGISIYVYWLLARKSS